MMQPEHVSGFMIEDLAGSSQRLLIVLRAVGMSPERGIVAAQAVNTSAVVETAEAKHIVEIVGPQIGHRNA
jgi:hypothetical protein